MNGQLLYKNPEKEEIILKVKPHLYNLEELLNEISRKIVKGIGAKSETHLEVNITIRSYGGKEYTINGKVIITNHSRKPLGKCLLSKSPINNTIFCENIQENIKYKLPNPDYYLSNIIIITKRVLNTVHYIRGQTIELHANINPNSTLYDPNDPKILIHRSLETIIYIRNSSEIRLYNPKIIPSVEY